MPELLRLHGLQDHALLEASSQAWCQPCWGVVQAAPLWGQKMNPGQAELPTLGVHHRLYAAYACVTCLPLLHIMNDLHCTSALLQRRSAKAGCHGCADLAEGTSDLGVPSRVSWNQLGSLPAICEGVWHHQNLRIHGQEGPGAEGGLALCTSHSQPLNALEPLALAVHQAHNGYGQVEDGAQLRSTHVAVSTLHVAGAAAVTSRLA